MYQPVQLAAQTPCLSALLAQSVQRRIISVLCGAPPAPQAAGIGYDVEYAAHSCSAQRVQFAVALVHEYGTNAFRSTERRCEVYWPIKNAPLNKRSVCQIIARSEISVAVFFFTTARMGDCTLVSGANQLRVLPQSARGRSCRADRPSSLCAWPVHRLTGPS